MNLLCLLTLLGTFTFSCAKVAVAQGIANQVKVCPNALALPDPFAVDPDDAKAIMTFISDVAAAPTVRVPFGMNAFFVDFWRQYRPDANPRTLRAQVKAVGFTSFAYRKLNLTNPVASECRRLLGLWRTFLTDVSMPDLAFEARVQLHRQAALSVPFDSDSIVAFLKMHFPELKWIPGHGGYFYFRELYARYLPELPFEPKHVKSTTTFAEARRDLIDYRILLEWRDYVRNLNPSEKFNPSRKYKMPAKSLKTRIVRGFPARLEDVPDNARIILAYLVHHSSTINFGDENAATLLFRELRVELGLPPREFDFAKTDLPRAYYSRIPAASERIRRAWRQTLEDLRAIEGD